MPACKVLDFRAAEFVSANNLRGLLRVQSAAINANPCHAAEISAIINHGKSLGV